VGNGIERLVRRALIGRLDGEPDETDYQRAYPIFLELYAENTFNRSGLYPGVREGLEFMRDAGYPLGCVTNKAARSPCRCSSISGSTTSSASSSAATPCRARSPIRCR
jgi:phosphoglycolate phosphatase-like HAD superfamily hydrolase